MTLAPSLVQRSYRTGGPEGRPRPSDCWRTPLPLFHALDCEFRFDVDAACTSVDCLCPTGLWLDRGHDAFLEEWGPEGATVFCNPPFSRVARWLERAILQARARTIACLIPADTSTRYWRHLVAEHAAEIRFLVGRPRFRLPDGSAHVTEGGGGGVTTPCAIAIFNPVGGPPRYGYMDSKPAVPVSPRPENEKGIR